MATGRVGENAIASWLRSGGWNVLPAYEIETPTGKGPRLFTATLGELVTPDMLVFKGRCIRWVEAKTKSSFTWYRTRECWQDGVDKRHWMDYCKVAELTGWQTWLLFLHGPGSVAKDTPEGMIPPVGLWGNELRKLRSSIDHESDRHASGMVYWSIDTLVQVAPWPLARKMVAA